MKKILIIIGMIVILGVFQGCGRKAVESWTYQAPNWTSDNKICFLEHHIIQRWEQTISGWTQSGGTEEINLYEINNDGSGVREVAEIESCEFEYGPELGGISTSSAANWIVLSIEDWRRGEHYPVIYVVKRNGDLLKEIGSGTYPDFSPDAEKIVYEKPNQGIWIKNRDGSNDHCIVPDSNASYPAWSPDGGRIAYFNKIIDTTGMVMDSVPSQPSRQIMDWGPESFNEVLLYIWGDVRRSAIYNLTTSKEETLKVYVEKWSPDGEYFIGGKTIYNRSGQEIFNINEIIKIGGE